MHSKLGSSAKKTQHVCERGGCSPLHPWNGNPLTIWRYWHTFTFTHWKKKSPPNMRMTHSSNIGMRFSHHFWVEKTRKKPCQSNWLGGDNHPIPYFRGRPWVFRGEIEGPYWPLVMMIRWWFSHCEPRFWQLPTCMYIYIYIYVAHGWWISCHEPPSFRNSLK